ncbi:MAG: hypothetical protein KAJ76_00575 [Candidatus Heimdallarchaeota archaeon]|nr:hypothetical protein [Candidatus Heimdallarchaeota archaeon]
MWIKKKRNLLLISLFILLIGLSINSTKITGHSPSNLTLEYGFFDQELTVLLVHSVADSNSHYIIDVDIWKNDVLVNSTSYTSQPTNSIFSYTYNISATVGDILEVTTECNQGGTKTEQITVTDNTITPSVPAAHVCIILIGISSTALFKMRRKVKRKEG